MINIPTAITSDPVLSAAREVMERDYPNRWAIARLRDMAADQRFSPATRLQCAQAAERLALGARAVVAA